MIEHPNWQVRTHQEQAERSKALDEFMRKQEENDRVWSGFKCKVHRDPCYCTTTCWKR